MRVLCLFPMIFHALPAREKSQTNPRRARAPNGVISTQILKALQALPILERFNFFCCVSSTQINACQRKKTPSKIQFFLISVDKNRTVVQCWLKSAVGFSVILSLFCEISVYNPNRMQQKHQLFMILTVPRSNRRTP